MQFNHINFNEFLENLAATRPQVDSILEHAVCVGDISQASIMLAWHTIYDLLLTVREPIDRMKVISLLKELMSAMNAREANNRKDSKDADGSPKPALDQTTFADLQEKLKLL